MNKHQVAGRDFLVFHPTSHTSMSILISLLIGSSVQCIQYMIFIERYTTILICLTLNTPGDLAISLGTSDTVFGITSEPRPSLEGHVFPNPVDPKCYMVMLCYKNGSLTREDVRNRCAESSWDTFNKSLEKTPAFNGTAYLMV